MKTKLTKKQRGFVKDYIKTGNGTQAALKNYDIESSKPEKVASVIAVENLAKPSVIAAIQDALPDELLAKVHLEGLEAAQKIVKDGVVLLDVPDYAVRHKYLDSAYKLKGLYAPDKSVSLTVSIDSNDPQAMQIAREYEARLKQTM